MYHPVANNDIVDFILHPVHMSMWLQIHEYVQWVAIATYVYMHTCMQHYCDYIYLLMHHAPS